MVLAIHYGQCTLCDAHVDGPKYASMLVCWAIGQGMSGQLNLPLTEKVDLSPQMKS